MQSLLRWSIENSAGSNSQSTQDRTPSQQPQQPSRIDPEIIDAILGRPDSVLMKEALEKATNEQSSEDTKLQALDDLEMLIEQIDNANNIEKMGMWQTIQSILSSDASSDAIRAAVLWIIGTAVQNNPAAQNAYLSLPDSPLSIILSRLSPSEASSGTRSKAVYALSGLLKHNARGVKLLEESGGWKVLKSALEDPDITVRRKSVFLLSSLLLPSAQLSGSSSETSGPRLHGRESESHSVPEHPNSHAGMTTESTATSDVTSSALREHGISGDLVQALVNPLPHGKDGDQEGDTDLEEKLVRLFFTYMTFAGGQLDQSDKEALLGWIRERRGKGEDWDLQAQELDALQQTLST